MGSLQGARVLRFRTALAVCLALGPSTRAATWADEAPLHDRIDALIEANNLAPVAPLASDADFVRRTYLDLSGTIPSAQVAREFLDNSSPAKRTELVDRLLAAPQFPRHLARVFDVMWTERRPEKGIKTDEWREYLRMSFAAGKPLNQLIAEILSADGAEPALRPAAKFYLDRDADANLIARDVGRLFFGRDFQCAQCHDHPLVADYLQSDYYGLVAFVNRGVLFTDKEKRSIYAENADGEVNYKSVFTGDARERVVPKLPDGAPLAEPLLSKEEQYVVAPGKGVRSVPKYSRRSQLAAQATGGGSPSFNRNLANRLWAHMLGRGLTYPLDMHHSGNPSANSQLLGLLADELVKMKFDTKAFLREVALSRAYQRSSEMPDRELSKLDPAVATAVLTACQTESQRVAGELEVLKSTDAQATTALNAAYEQFSKSAAARETAQKAHADAKKTSDEAAAALAAAIKDVDTKFDVVKALNEARDKAAVAAAKLPDDKPLADAAAQFKTRAAEIEAQLATARAQVAERTALTQAASLKIAEVGAALDKASAEVTAMRAALDAADVVARIAVEKLRAARTTNAELAARIADAQAVIDCDKLAVKASASQSAAQAAAEQLAAAKSQGSTTAEQLAQGETAARAAADTAAADRIAADQSWAALADRSQTHFVLGALKPLSPEQLTWGMLQGLGYVDQQVTALEPQVKKDVEALANLTPEARAAAESRMLEERVDEKLRGTMVPFVPLFGQQAGQAASFNATVHQALFLTNGELLAGWLKPSGNNLTDRLSKIDQPAALAEELYLSILSRRPTADEEAEVARYCGAEPDRAAAVREMTWSLVAGSEFRFNH